MTQIDRQFTDQSAGREPQLGGDRAGTTLDPGLVSLMSNLGAFGVLAAGNMPPELFAEYVAQTRELTDRPFGVNFHMYQPNAADIVDMVIRHGVRAVSYSRSPGPEFIRKLKDAGVVCMPTVGLKWGRRCWLR